MKKLYLFLMVLILTACSHHEESFVPDGRTAYCKQYTEDIFILRGNTLNRPTEDAIVHSYIHFMKGDKICLDSVTDFVRDDTIYINDTLFFPKTNTKCGVRIVVPSRYFDFKHRIPKRGYDNFAGILYHNIWTISNKTGYDPFSYITQLESTGNKQSRTYMWYSVFLLLACAGIWFYILFSRTCPTWLFWSWVVVYGISSWYQGLYFISYQGDIFADTFHEPSLYSLYVPYIILHAVLVASICGNFNNRYAYEREVPFKMALMGLFVFVLLVAAGDVFDSFWGYGTLYVSIGIGTLFLLYLFYLAYSNSNPLLPLLALPVIVAIGLGFFGVFWISLNNFGSLICMWLVLSVVLLALGANNGVSMREYCCQDCPSFHFQNSGKSGYCYRFSKWRHGSDSLCTERYREMRQDYYQRLRANDRWHAENPTIGDHLVSMASALRNLLLGCIDAVSTAE